MKFIGRDKELREMEKLYNKESFQMLVLYGRRRIGKTCLLNKFAEDKNALYYTGVESKDGINLEEFGNAVFHHFNPGVTGIVFKNYSDILGYITDCVRNSGNASKSLIILDEFPYMAEYATELCSILQREIDREWLNLNIMLVLCGSSITFMEEKVLGEKSPLFGRRTAQIDLQPFGYKESALFVENYSPEDKAIVYGITGGIPKYLDEIDSQVSLEENIVEKFFSTSGYFYEEPKNLLRQEFRDVPLYFAILSAIGGGCTQVNEISNRTGFDTPKLSQALRKLEAVRIIRKEIPILNEKNRKLAQYFIRDGMFGFWFRFVEKGTSAIERNYGEEYYKSMVAPQMHDYMGRIFELMCQEYAFESGMKGRYPDMPTRVGKWRGHDSVKKCPADIDVVLVNDKAKTAVIGECKFRNAQFGREEYETLMNRGRLIYPYEVCRYLVFSLSGVTPWVAEQENSAVEIVSLEKMMADSF